MSNPPDADAGDSQKNLQRLGVVALIFAALLAYVPAMSGGFIWDDDFLVHENPALHGWAGLKTIWFEPAKLTQYYPLVFSSFWLENQLFGMSPLHFHVVNVLLHIANAFLCWRVLTRLQIPGAAFAAALFLLHPVHVESVAWISERKNVLSGFFYLSSMLACLRFYGIGPRAAAPAEGKWIWHIAALALFLLALLSKTVTCSLPAVLVLILWWKEERLSLKKLAPLVPFFVLGVALGLNTVWMERKLVGAEGDEWSLTAVERCLVAGRALWFYAAKLLWPAPLSFVYPRWVIDSGAWWQYLFPAAAAAVLIAAVALRARIGKGALTALLCFSGTLVPALGFFNVYPHRFSFVADHFQYLASIAMLALFAAGLALAARKWQLAARIRVFAAACVLLLFSGMVWKQGGVYGDLRTLWTDTLAKNPDCWLAHYNLGNVERREGRLREAAMRYRRAVELNPRYAQALGNLGAMHMDAGELDASADCYQRAIAIQPGDARLHYNLGLVRIRQKKPDAASAHFEDAIKRAYSFPEAHTNLGNLRYAEGKLDAAIKHFEDALVLRPDDAVTQNSIGAALAAQGRFAEAATHFETAFKLNPSYADAAVNFSTCAMRIGDFQKALEIMAQAVENDPAHALARYRLGTLFEQGGDFTQAAAHYRKALEQNGDWPDALARLAWVMAAASDEPEKAVALAEKARQLGGDKPHLLDALAASYAAAKRYADALKTAERAAELAAAAGDNTGADAIRKRISAYKEKIEK